MNPHKRLFSPDAAVTVRGGLIATDAGAWTPTADADILDAREWETLRVFIGGSATSATLTPLIRAGASATWLALASTGAIAVGATVEVPVEGHFASFRVTALSGSPLDIRVTGGRKRRNISGG
jgi:hypothetical protein